MNSHDYKSDTKYDGLVNVVTLSYYGYSCEIIEKLVKYFSGWYMENDCRYKVKYYDFNK